MSTTGQFSTKNPTIKRILKESQELTLNPSPDFTASPLDSDLFEWHFTLRGPPSPSPFASGIYHGRIVLPPSYPLRPPSFRFLTPSGRFEVNREICLSISGFHEETWQPAWGVRTALLAIRGFMDSEAGGAVGAMDADEGVRRRLARESQGWSCKACGRGNAEIMEELRERCEGSGKKEGEEEKVPQELRLGYRDELAKGKEGEVVTADGGVVVAAGDGSAAAVAAAGEREAEVAVTRAPKAVPATMPIRTPQVPQATGTISSQPALVRERPPAESTSWLDRAIMGVAMALAAMIVKHYVL